MSNHYIARALILALITSVGITAAVPGVAWAQSPVLTEMSAGREAFDGSNYALAERHFQGALEVAGSDGQKSTALYSLGVIAQRQGRFDEAKEQTAKAVELSPKNSQAQRLLEELNATAANGAPAKPKPVRQAAAPSDPIQTGALPAPKPQRKAAAKETAPAVVEQVAAKPKEAAPKPAARVPAVAAAAATVAPKFDPTAIGKVEASGARLLWTFPAEKREILGAGFTGTDQQITVVTGPLADAAAGEIELRRYDLRAGTLGDAYSLHSDMKTAVVAVPSSGGTLATAVAAGSPGKKSATKVSLHLWNAETVDNTEAIEMEGADRGTGIALDHLEFSRNGKRLIASHRGGVEIFDTTGLKGVDFIKVTSRRDAVTAKTAMAVSANGSRVVLTNGARIRVVEGGKMRDIGPGGNSPPFDKIAMTDNGGLVAASSAAGVRFYDVQSGKESEALPASPDVAAGLAFSPTGDKLAVADGNRVRVWTVQGRKALVDLEAAGPVDAVVFSSDGRMVLAASQVGTRVWYVDPAAITPMPAGPGMSSVPVASAPVASDIATASVAKPAAAPAPQSAPVQVVNAEPAKSDPALEKARRNAELSVERAGALERSDCDRVKALDAEIGSGALFATCASRLEQANREAENMRREAERRQKEALATERTAALGRTDCDRVKALDAVIGNDAQLGACTAKIEQAKRQATEYERNAVVAERKAAIDGGSCEAVKALDAKLGDGDNYSKCAFQSVLKTGSARELYLAAAKYDADRDRVPAKQLYRAIVDRFPQDDLAIRAAERMTTISDQEARAAPAPAAATAEAAVDPVRRTTVARPRKP